MAQANITSHVRLRNHISGYTDVIQMLTGVLLCCFVLMHMVLVSSVILSPKIMDSLAVFLETSYLAQIGGPIILLVMILHFILAARKMPFSPLELREFWRQAKMMHHMDTWLWCRSPPRSSSLSWPARMSSTSCRICPSPRIRARRPFRAAWSPSIWCCSPRWICISPSVYTASA